MVVLDLVVPPGPVAVKSYVVACLGDTVFSPLVGTGLMPLMSASTVSAEVHFSWLGWPQSIFAGVAEISLLTGATATVAFVANP